MSNQLQYKRTKKKNSKVEAERRAMHYWWDYFDRELKRSKPICRICGEEGHVWQRCGND